MLENDFALMKCILQNTSPEIPIFAFCSLIPWANFLHLLQIRLSTVPVLSRRRFGFLKVREEPLMNLWKNKARQVVGKLRGWMTENEASYRGSGVLKTPKIEWWGRHQNSERANRKFLKSRLTAFKSKEKLFYSQINIFKKSYLWQTMSMFK